MRNRSWMLAGSGLLLGAGLVLSALALVLFGLLAERVSLATPVSLDVAVLAALRAHGSPALDSLALAVSFFGSQGIAVIVAALVVIFAWRRRWLAALQPVVVAGGAQLLDDGLKEIVQRARPTAVPAGLIPAQGYSFPSGHAMVSAAFYLYLAYLAWRFVGPRWRGPLVAAVLLVVFLIGLSRLYLAVHYLTDVVAGYLAGFVWFWFVTASGRLMARYHGRSTALEVGA